MAFALDPDGFVDMDTVPDEPVDLDLAAEAAVPALPEPAWLRLLAVARDPSMHDPAVDDLIPADVGAGGPPFGHDDVDGPIEASRDEEADLDADPADALDDPFGAGGDALHDPADPADEPADGVGDDDPTFGLDL